MSIQKRVFLSHSSADHGIADRIANDLRVSGTEVWYDDWEILAGDSLVDKVFNEGLSKADIVIILISQNSVNSKWVKDELNHATIRRIEENTRIIPVKIDDAQIPAPLRTLKWVDISEDYDEKLREIQKAIFGMYERPSVGQPPDFIKNQKASVGGLSRLATSLGMFFISTGNSESGNEETFSAAKLSDILGLSPEETDDAIDELEKYGMVESVNFLGTSPFSHGDITPTYALFLNFKDAGLDYNPEDDIKAVASAIADGKQINGKKLAELTKLSPLRINRAVSFLEDYGLVKVLKEFGTRPYNFGEIWATSETRRFVAEKCK